MRIPDHLVTFDMARWLPEVESVCHYRACRATEKFRQAQDRWATAHGIGRSEFEQLCDQQKHPGGCTPAPNSNRPVMLSASDPLTPESLHGAGG